MVVDELIPIVGEDNVIRDPDLLSRYSQDLFFWSDARLAAAVVTPRCAAAVVKLIEWARAREFKLFTRGGGMSCSAGYVPNCGQSLIVDTRHLNRVLGIDEINGFVEVECGVTWEALFAQLSERGLTTVFEAPVSGNVSTVGGALSQGVTGEMNGVLGLEVVTGTGSCIRTGSGGRSDNPTPFFRQFGPDLTGLFCGDAGALGIKTKATLTLRPKAPAQAHASFAFETFAALTQAAAQCGASHQLVRCIGLDPKKSQNAPKVGFRKSIESVAAILGDRPDGRLAEALRIARSGRNFMAGVKWSLHLSAEGINAEVAQAKLDAARESCLSTGAEIANLLPLALASKPFSVRGFLGPKGERWVPVNAVFACGQAVEACQALLSFFSDHRAEMNRLQVWESYLVRGHAGQVAIEPSLYWPDEVSALQLHYLDGQTARQFAKLPPNPQARALVMDLHAKLAECLDGAGAAHVQLGRCHRYKSRMSADTGQLIEAIKGLTDPQNLLNPGSLELNQTYARG